MRAHHRVCLVCKVFVGDPCAQQFQIDAKKNQMKIVRGKMHNGKRSKEIFFNFFFGCACIFASLPEQKANIIVDPTNICLCQRGNEFPLIEVEGICR